ncbi:MAG: YwiC-like family protein [Chloroflexi bacterium]|nr:YwiC-like family protein [Chloroflexota bacterium]
MLEPVLLGLVLAPTWAGLSLSLAALAVFLLHQPLKIALKDRNRGRHYQRTGLAERFALGYGLLTMIFGGTALILAGPAPAIPLIFAVPFGLILIAYDLQNKSREALPEIAGALAFGALAAALVMIDGWSLGRALLLWAGLAPRSITSILYIRERLHLAKDRPVAFLPVIVAHGAAWLWIGLAVAFGLISWPVLLGLAVLTVRAAWGLSPLRRALRTPIIGVLELGYGLLYVISIVASYHI